MHNIFSNLLRFTSFFFFFAHLGASANDFNCNNQNRILGKRNHELKYAIGLGAESQYLSSVAPPRKKKLVTIFSQRHVWGPQKPMFY